MNKSKKLIIVILVLSLIMIICYLTVDLLNLFSKFGNLNIEVFSLLINNLVVVDIFLITFIVIDKKSIDKEKNSKEAGKLLMGRAYKSCLELLSVLDNSFILEKYIVKKIDFNKPDIDSPLMQNIQNTPFELRKDVLELAYQGLISKKELQNYLEICDDYKHLVSLKITFFDIDSNSNTPQQLELREIIHEKEKSLKIRLETSITRLEEE